MLIGEKMSFEGKSTEFKRAIHALSYALSLSQDIKDAFSWIEAQKFQDKTR